MTESAAKPLPRLSRCPTCKKSAVYDTANAFRPFCSARCKNEDIIGWADESFKIPGKPVAPAQSEDGQEGLRPSGSSSDEDA